MGSLTDISRYMSLILRHKPQTIGITLDEHGRANQVWLTKEVPVTYLRKV